MRVCAPLHGRAAAMLATLMLAAPSAAQNATIRLAPASASVAPGAALDVPIVADFSGVTGVSLASLTVRITYDPARLTLQSTTAGSFGSMTSASPQPGTVNVTLFATQGTSTTFTAATLRFQTGTVAGATTLTPTVVSAGDEQGRSIASRVQAASPLAICVGAGGGETWGDANGDGAVDAIDAQQIARFSIGLSVADAAHIQRVGDVSTDGVADIIDAQQVARFAAGLATSGRVGQPTGGSCGPTSGGTVARVTVAPGTATVGVMSSITLTAAAADATGVPVTGRAVTWSSSDPAVATVADGVVSGVAPGTATMRATIDGVSGSATVDVTPGMLVRGVLAAGPTGDGGFDAVALGADGSRLASRVDALGRVAGGTLVLKDGSTLTLTLYPDGYPQRVVVGDAILTFANYTATTVDVAVLLPTGETRIQRAVPLDPKAIDALRALATGASAARFGAAADGFDWQRHLTYLSLGFSVVSCGASVVATWGTFGLTTGLAVVSCGATAVEVMAFLTPAEQTEVGSSLGAAGNIASAIECLDKKVPECISLTIGVVKNNSDLALSLLAASGRLLGEGDQQLSGVARLSIAPARATIWPGETVDWSVNAFDGAGLVVARPPLTWSKSRYGVAEVDATRGTTLGTDTGTVDVEAAVGDASATATVDVRWPADADIVGTYTLSRYLGTDVPQSEGRSGNYYKSGELTVDVDGTWSYALRWVSVYTSSDGTVSRKDGETRVTGQRWSFSTALDTNAPILRLGASFGFCVRRDHTLIAIQASGGFTDLVCDPAGRFVESEWKR